MAALLDVFVYYATLHALHRGAPRNTEMHRGFSGDLRVAVGVARGANASASDANASERGNNASERGANVSERGDNASERDA